MTAYISFSVQYVYATPTSHAAYSAIICIVVDIIMCYVVHIIYQMSNNYNYYADTRISHTFSSNSFS